MVLEGVHLVPGLVPAKVEGALIVHVIVEIPDEEAHRMHFHVRDVATGGIRAMDKYLDHIDAIRRSRRISSNVRSARACRWSRTRMSSARSTRSSSSSCWPPTAPARPSELASKHAELRRGRRSAAPGRGSRAWDGYRRARAVLRCRGRGREGEGDLHAHLDGLPCRRDDPGGHRARRRRDPGCRSGRERAHASTRPGRRIGCPTTPSSFSASDNGLRGA